MLRGSRPGERRGGRERDTPNRRTVLTDRILAIGSDHPTASRHGFLVKLVKDQKLPADIRMAVAPICFPAKRTQSGGARRPGVSAGIRSAIGERTTAKAKASNVLPAVEVPAREVLNPQALDALFGVVQDAAADHKARRRAALKIAEFLLPKSSPKAKALTDEYGFGISPQLARKYRDIELELRSLVNEPTCKIPDIEQKIKKLMSYSDAIRLRLRCPRPTDYDSKEVTQDYLRLSEFTRLRDNKIALTEVQDAEEAHIKARFDTFAKGPESTARRRRKALQDAEQRFKMSQLTGDFCTPPLSRNEQNDLALLRWLYPKKIELTDSDCNDLIEYHYHPFRHESPASNGNFYPPGSPLRPQDSVGNDGPPLKHEEPSSIASRDDSVHADERADTDADILERWLRGTEKFQPFFLRQVAGVRLGKEKGSYPISELVPACVEAKIVPEDEVCEELRCYLPAKAARPPNAKNADVLERWLRGTEQFPFYIVRKAGRALLGKNYEGASELVPACVEAKIVSEDEVCENLRCYLPAKSARPQNVNADHLLDM
jgi:hypothetical protein